MKAIVYQEYGSPAVLQLKEVEKPFPKEGEVLVRVQAASLNAADWRMMRADPFLVRFHAGLFRPNKFPTLGADIAGNVEAVGLGVTQFRAGDEVFGDVFASGFGGFAEYKCAKEHEVVLKPSNISFQETAAVPLAGLTALHALRDAGKLQRGQTVLINGASGGVGTFAVQLANYFGTEVTAVCSSRNVEIARSLGAHHVIDYSAQDFAQNGQKYDVVLAVNGFRSIFDYRRVLKPNGRYVMVGGNTGQIFQALLLGPFLSMVGAQKTVAVSSKPNQQDLLFLAELLSSKQIKSVIDRSYPLREVPDAIRYLEQGHAVGKVIITQE